MSTFAKATFNGNLYGAARPTYPKQLFDLVFRYHESLLSGSSTARSDLTEQLEARRAKPRWDCALDLGCGTGQSTIDLHPFKRIIGADPSKAMLDRAKQYAKESLGHVPESTPPSASASGEAGRQIVFEQSSAEDLSFLADGSVDLVVSSQAAHWLNWGRVWPELARVLRTGGTAAIWCYSQMRLPRHPSTIPLIQHFMESPIGAERAFAPNPDSEPTKKLDTIASIASYWEQPGRRILDNHLQDIPDASRIVPGAFVSEERIHFTGSYHPSLPSPRPVILRKTMTFDQFEDYIRSLSAFHTFREANPEDDKNVEGDVVKRFLHMLKKQIKDEPNQSQVREDEVVVEWPLTIILAKRS